MTDTAFYFHKIGSYKYKFDWYIYIWPRHIVKDKVKFMYISAENIPQIVTDLENTIIICIEYQVIYGLCIGIYLPFNYNVWV